MTMHMKFVAVRIDETSRSWSEKMTLSQKGRIPIAIISKSWNKAQWFSRVDSSFRSSSGFER